MHTDTVLLWGVCAALLLPADHSRVLLNRSLQQSLQYSPLAHDAVLFTLTPPLTFSLKCHDLCPRQLFQCPSVDLWTDISGSSGKPQLCAFVRASVCVCVCVCQGSALVRRWASVASAAENLMMLRHRDFNHTASLSLSHTHSPHSLLYLSQGVGRSTCSCIVPCATNTHSLHFFYTRAHLTQAHTHSLTWRSLRTLFSH